MRTWKSWTILAALCLIGAGVAVAQLANSNYRQAGGLRWVIGGSLDVESGGSLAIESGGESEFESGSDLKMNGMLTLAPTAVALTSPTVTFSAADVSYISLTSDANLTGIRPINGTLNQVLMIISGAGSNTLQFDDATSAVLGGNIVLTEAQLDVLSLICTNAGVTGAGSVWAATGAHDN